MQSLVLILSLATVAFAAPQLFLVLPQQLISAHQHSVLGHESSVPVVVPIEENNRATASEVHETQSHDSAIESLAQPPSVAAEDSVQLHNSEVKEESTVSVNTQSADTEVALDDASQVNPAEEVTVGSTPADETHNTPVEITNDSNKEIIAAEISETVEPEVSDVVPEVKNEETPVVAELPETNVVPQIEEEPILSGEEASQNESVTEAVVENIEENVTPSGEEALVEQSVNSEVNDTPVVFEEVIVTESPAEELTPVEEVTAVQSQDTTEVPVAENLPVSNDVTLSNAFPQLFQEPTPAEELSKKKEEPAQENIIRGSGKSLDSTSSVTQNEVISGNAATHFGFSDPSHVVKTTTSLLMHEGHLVDPRTLVEPSYRSFFYDNDSPDVTAAKVSFFRLQAALTPKVKIAV